MIPLPFKLRFSAIAALFAAFFQVHGAHAQTGRKHGPDLIWQHEITLTPATIRHGGRDIEGFSFLVHETNGRDLTNVWRTDHSPISSKISTRDPMQASGAMIPILSSDPLTVLARVEDEKRNRRASISLAYVGPDSLPLSNSTRVQDHVRELAVRYNKAVVEAQISAHEAAMKKSGGRLAKSEATEGKRTRDLNKTTSELEVVKARRMKQQAKNAQLQGNVVGAEQKFTVTNDPKDMRRLTRARSQHSAGEVKVAGFMEKEAKLGQAASRLQGSISGSHQQTQDQRTQFTEQEKVLDALRVKLMAIR